jgi:hypothetical protein
MTATDTQVSAAGAFSAPAQMWEQANWSDIDAEVKRLQMRIAKAVREGRWGKAKALQRLLTRSHSGKMLAVKRVTENSGKRTPGVDGRTWLTPAGRWKGMLSLRHRGYRAMPLRRVYIPKSNGAASAGNSLYAVPGDAGLVEARSGTCRGNTGGCKLLRLSASAFDCRCHRTVRHGPVATRLCAMGAGG